jgi:hypothetical protein
LMILGNGVKLFDAGLLYPMKPDLFYSPYWMYTLP